jgi:D-3-phosphoglycerate dehydrogenase / 2-oxoglutarate reductase
VTTEGESLVAGTIFGKKDTRVVRINTFRLEMIPLGHMALIHNLDVPGSIGEIGTTLGRHGVNIARMQVGQEEGGERNIIFSVHRYTHPAGGDRRIAQFAHGQNGNSPGI